MNRHRQLLPFVILSVALVMLHPKHARAEVSAGPGIALLLPIDSYFVGADARLLYVFQGFGGNGIGVFLTGGGAF